MDDARIQKVRNGSLAGLALDFFAQAVKTEQGKILNQMMMDCRGKTLEHDKLVMYAAGYTALEDLVNQLRQTEKNGFKADKKEILVNE